MQPKGVPEGEPSVEPSVEHAELLAEGEALRREVERLRALAFRDRGLLEAILNNSPHGIIVCDAQGKLTLQNKAAERIWAGSATAESVAEWGRYRAFHPDGRPFQPHDWAMARCLGQGDVVQAEEVHIQRFDDTHGVLLGSCAPIYGPGGEIDGALSVFADITGFKEMEQALAERERRLADIARAEHARLEETVRFSEKFMAILAHDLRNPLTAIMTTADVITRRSQDEKILEPLQRIQSSTRRITRMIEQLLDFTRARIGGGFEVRRRRVDLHALCREILAEVEAASPKYKFELRQVGDVYGDWDPDRLSQVLSNLLGNGVQHGSCETPVSVRIDGSRSDAVTVHVTNQGTIPPDLLPTIFDPFLRARRDERAAQGLGLGLHITEQIVLAHGGTIGVRSEEGLTTFAVELPRSA